MTNINKTNSDKKNPKNIDVADDFRGKNKGPKITGRNFGGRIFKNFGNRGRRGR